MFSSGFVVGYLLLNTYVLLRIGALVTHWGFRISLAAGFILIVAAFPVTEALSHSTASLWLDPVLMAGYCALPFLLYLFLLVMLLDLFRLFNRFARVIRQDVLSGRRFRTASLSLLLAIPAVTVAAGIWKNNTIVINEYRVEVPRRASPLRHLRIALAADFHLKEQTGSRFMEHFVGKVNSLGADILLIPGDLLEGDRQEARLEEFEQQFRLIRTKDGIFASPGNHEYFGRRSRGDFFEKSGIVLLRDSVVVVDGAFAVVGRNDSRVRGRKMIGELMRPVGDHLPVIVLDHRPTDLEGASAANADLLLCGHTHDGQLFPFNLITARVYEVSWGYKKVRNTHVFVTSGIQLWGPPVRTAGDSEIMAIDVDFNDR